MQPTLSDRRVFAYCDAGVPCVLSFASSPFSSFLLANDVFLFPLAETASRLTSSVTSTLAPAKASRFISASLSSSFPFPPSLPSAVQLTPSPAPLLIADLEPHRHPPRQNHPLPLLPPLSPLPRQPRPLDPVGRAQSALLRQLQLLPRWEAVYTRGGSGLCGDD